MYYSIHPIFLFVGGTILLLVLLNVATFWLIAKFWKRQGGARYATRCFLICFIVWGVLSLVAGYAGRQLAPTDFQKQFDLMSGRHSN
jgi:uncharacterized membrane protein